MAKTSNKSKKMNLVYKKRAVIALVALAIVLPPLYGFWLVYQKLDVYNRASELTSSAQTRDLIIGAIDGLKKPAPVDPKTGDFYFPENRLYLPAGNAFDGLLYSSPYDISEDEGKPMTVTTQSAMRGAKVKLYNAGTVKQLFEAVPELQACSRGVQLTFGPAKEPQGTLLETVNLANGRVLHMYSEDTCPELDVLVEQLKNIRSY